MKRAFKQLEFVFFPKRVVTSAAVVGQAHRLPLPKTAGRAPALQFVHGRDHALELLARELLRTNGAGRIANEIRVEWNPRLKSCAGRADYREKLISLNPLLRYLGDGSTQQRAAGESSQSRSQRSAVIHDEIDRTFRHELAHLLAQFRAGRRRILPHGKEWCAASADLGIGGEKRCHNLPFPYSERAQRLLYQCPNCERDFPRVRKIRRAIACLACCRAHNRGEFDPRFRLKLIHRMEGHALS